MSPGIEVKRPVKSNRRSLIEIKIDAIDIKAYTRRKGQSLCFSRYSKGMKTFLFFGSCCL
jgi:hypothetical protein